MKDFNDSIRDALASDAERAPHAPLTWTGPMADVDALPNRRPYAWMAVAATVALVVGGLWVVARRDAAGTGTFGHYAEVAGLDFSGTHRAEMEAEFPPDPGAPMLESALYGSKSGAYELETANLQDMMACMKAVGFEFPKTLTRAAIESDVSQIVRSLTAESAAKYGYEGVRTVSAASLTTPEAYRATLSTLKQQLFDAAAQECGTRSRTDTFTDYSKYEARRVVMEEQRNQFIDAFAASPQVRSLDAAWSSCMNGKAYAVANIVAAYELASAASTAQRAKDIAVADADCRAATNYEASYVELYRNAESGFVYEHRAQILELLQLRYGKLLQSEGKPYANRLRATAVFYW